MNTAPISPCFEAVGIATGVNAATELPPLYLAFAPAGFPSPADDYIDKPLDLNKYLVTEPSATFFVKAAGLSMVNAGIMDKALLVVNRAKTPKHDDVVIAALDGEITCKILDLKAQVLRAANLSFAAIPIGEDSDCVVLGVVTHAINPLCSRW
ncbi:MAG: translesion error-prone DNA polymerase V autoproteolytic subunit [Gammaproteobacteria bacterium]|nr:translesion error-prone DNA polymerase V autoproteolytic subunit [Gammaproteobacteria bacterium]MBL4573491.1 translesion error-prone DNA polymerase V autoproteolytic subunit [Gammaproteobacteria bacterium]MBL4729752.1 translesion error-prone DNA polymerase V autoproteolytic subunit [Gammaproteobacteria bacterium]